jgi:hypothetical protein
MGKISTYTVLSTPTLNDKLIGTDVTTNNETKNFLVSDLLALGVGGVGPTGPQGPQGIQGTTGAQGAASTVAGPTGPQGPQGIAGVTGAQGAASTVAGPIGPQGSQGIAGVTGAQGVQGVTGIQGSVGPIGPAGLNWQGTYSPTGTYVLNDAVGFGGASYYNILACSSCAGDPSLNTTNWALLANIGATGAVGPTGPQGLIGLTGATGPQGVIGLTGAAGAQGIQGIQGATGATGPQGVIGTIGATGAQGPQGIQGAVGPIGPQGVIGATGAQGPIGLTGANGVGGVTTAGVGGITITGAGTVVSPYIVNNTVPYKIYKVLLSNFNGTFTVNQLENTIGDGSNLSPGDIQWSNPSNGIFYATKTGEFSVPSKIFITVPSMRQSTIPWILTANRSTNNIISVSIFLYDGTQTTTPNLSNIPFEIRIYS